MPTWYARLNVHRGNSHLLTYKKENKNVGSREKDWLGHARRMPQGLNICELEIFAARLKELREGSK